MLKSLAVSPERIPSACNPDLAYLRNVRRDSQGRPPELEKLVKSNEPPAWKPANYRVTTAEDTGFLTIQRPHKVYVTIRSTRNLGASGL